MPLKRFSVTPTRAEGGLRSRYPADVDSECGGSKERWGGDEGALWVAGCRRPLSLKKKKAHGKIKGVVEER